MIKFIKSFFTKRESKFEHPLDAVTTPKVVEEVIAPVVETPVTETPQKKKRNYNKKTK
jgi:hypothetical protein